MKAKKTHRPHIELTPAELKERWDKKREQAGVLSTEIRSLRNNVTRALKSDDEKERLTALVVALLLETSERIGNNTSAGNGHFGVTGMQKRHFRINGSSATLKYDGKTGVQQNKVFTDATIVAALKKAIKNSPNKNVFTTSDGFQIKADRVNSFLKEYGSVSAKSIRGFNANKFVLDYLKKETPAEDEKKRKKQFNAAAKYTAKRVGHGTGTLKNQYLFPELMEEFVAKGKLINLEQFAPGGQVMEAGGATLQNKPLITAVKDRLSSRVVDEGFGVKDRKLLDPNAEYKWETGGPFDDSGKVRKFTPTNITRDEIWDIIHGKCEKSDRTLIETTASYLRANAETVSAGREKNGSGNKEQEKKLIADFVDANHLWYDDDLLIGKYLTKGGEQKVYRLNEEDEDYVVKVNDCGFYNSWLDYLESLLLHNFFFTPYTTYELLGFTWEAGELFSVVKQRWVEETKPKLTPKRKRSKIKALLEDIGFENIPKGTSNYYNPTLCIGLMDLHTGNVLTKKDDDGRDTLYFIDTIAYITREPKKFDKGGEVAPDLKVAPNKAGRAQVKNYGIDIIEAKKGEASNVLLEQKYKHAKYSEFERGFTFQLLFILKSKIDQQKRFAVAHFGDSSANRYEYATASNDIQELIDTLKEYDTQEAVIEVYDPATKEVSASVIYPGANTYTFESLLGLKSNGEKRHGELKGTNVFAHFEAAPGMATNDETPYWIKDDGIDAFISTDNTAEPNLIYISRIDAHDEGKGYGTKFIEKLKNCAHENGYAGLFAYPENDKSRNFFIKNGFREESQDKSFLFYREAAVVAPEYKPVPVLLKASELLRATVYQLNQDRQGLGDWSYEQNNEIEKKLKEVKGQMKGMRGKNPEKEKLQARVDELNGQLETIGNQVETEMFLQVDMTDEFLREYIAENKLVPLSYFDSKKAQEKGIDEVIFEFWESIFERPGTEQYWDRTAEYVLLDILGDFKLNREIKLGDDYSPPMEVSQVTGEEMPLPVVQLTDYLLSRTKGAKLLFAKYQTADNYGFMPSWQIAISTPPGVQLFDQQEVNIIFDCSVYLKKVQETIAEPLKPVGNFLPETDELLKRAIKKIQWKANKEGRPPQKYGNQSIIVPTDEYVFEKYIKGHIRKGFGETFPEYRQKVGETYYSFIRKDNSGNWIEEDRMRDLEELMPPPQYFENGWALEVTDFQSPEAIKQGMSADSDQPGQPETGSTCILALPYKVSPGDVRVATSMFGEVYISLVDYRLKLNGMLLRMLNAEEDLFKETGSEENAAYVVVFEPGLYIAFHQSAKNIAKCALLEVNHLELPKQQEKEYLFFAEKISSPVDYVLIPEEDFKKLDCPELTKIKLDSDGIVNEPFHEPVFIPASLKAAQFEEKLSQLYRMLVSPTGYITSQDGRPKSEPMKEPVKEIEKPYTVSWQELLARKPEGRKSVENILAALEKVKNKLVLSKVEPTVRAEKTLEDWKKEPTFPYCLPSYDKAKTIHPLDAFWHNNKPYLYIGSMSGSGKNGKNECYIYDVQAKKKLTISKCFGLNGSIIDGVKYKHQDLPESYLQSLKKFKWASKETARRWGENFKDDVFMILRYNEDWGLFITSGKKHLKDFYTGDLVPVSRIEQKIKPSDIEAYFGSISVPKVKKVSDAKLMEIEDRVSSEVAPTSWANIEEMKHLCISFSTKQTVTEEEKVKIAQILSEIL